MKARMTSVLPIFVEALPDRTNHMPPKTNARLRNVPLTIVCVRERLPVVSTSAVALLSLSISSRAARSSLTALLGISSFASVASLFRWIVMFISIDFLEVSLGALLGFGCAMSATAPVAAKRTSVIKQIIRFIVISPFCAEFFRELYQQSSDSERIKPAKIASDILSLCAFVSLG